MARLTATCLLLMLVLASQLSCSPASHIESLTVSADGKMTVKVLNAMRRTYIRVAVYRLDAYVSDNDLQLDTRTLVANRAVEQDSMQSLEYVFEDIGLQGEAYLVTAADSAMFDARLVRPFEGAYAVVPAMALVVEQLEDSPVFPGELAHPTGEQGELLYRQLLFSGSQRPVNIAAMSIEGGQLDFLLTASPPVGNLPSWIEVYRVEPEDCPDYESLVAAIREGELSLKCWRGCQPDSLHDLQGWHVGWYRERILPGMDYVVLLNMDDSMLRENTDPVALRRFHLTEDGHLQEVPVPGLPQK